MAWVAGQSTYFPDNNCILQNALTLTHSPTAVHSIDNIWLVGAIDMILVRK